MIFLRTWARIVRIAFRGLFRVFLRCTWMSLGAWTSWGIRTCWERVEWFRARRSWITRWTWSIVSIRCGAGRECGWRSTSRGFGRWSRKWGCTSSQGFRRGTLPSNWCGCTSGPTCCSGGRKYRGNIPRNISICNTYSIRAGLTISNPRKKRKTNHYQINSNNNYYYNNNNNNNNKNNNNKEEESESEYEEEDEEIEESDHEEEERDR